MSRLLSAGIAALLCWTATAYAQRPSMVFLNPGFSHEEFWIDYYRYMQDAAQDLDIELSVMHGERDNARMMNNARQVLESADPPDYVLFANEQFTGPEILRMYADSPIKLFALHSTLTAEQQALVGGSRERYANWIGSLTPNDEEAGYLTGKGLITLAGGQPTEMLAFTGIKQTPSAVQRLEGLQRALRDAPHIRLNQALYGEWQSQRAYEQANALLPRYPGVTLIWSANDEMAFGVMQAAVEQNRPLHYSAVNNSPRVLQARADGQIEVLVSGHFLLGACGLVMLRDHADGVDFAERGGKDQVAQVLRLVDGQEAAQLAKRLAQQDIDVDFRRFSATRQPQADTYNCSIEALL